MEGLIGVREAAKLLGLSRWRIIQLIKEKRLPALKLEGKWLMNSKDLDAARNRPGPGRPRKGKPDEEEIDENQMRRL